MKKLLVSKKYLHRHRILEVLQNRMKENNHPNAIPEDMQFSYQALIKESGLTETQILMQLDFLHIEEEISIDEIEFTSYYIILRKGTAAFYDEKYIRQGRKNFLDNSYDILKNFVAASVLIGSICTFISFIHSFRNGMEKIAIELQKKQKEIPVKETIETNQK